jgi:low affinity Fe/Cu permease
MLMDKIDLDEIGMQEKIKTEIERHKKFNSNILGIKEKAVRVGEIDIRNYAKYILRDGSIWEKRELLSCLKSKVKMNNKVVRIVEV